MSRSTQYSSAAVLKPPLLSRRTISLRSFESSYQHNVELAFSEIELFSMSASQSSFPSTLPFAIPLLPDIPQSIQTPHSLLAHTLTATLHPMDRNSAPLSKSLTVHTRRYSSHSSVLPSVPQCQSLDNPTTVNVELPRPTFTSGEPIPLYVTVPPPPKELVIEHGLRLRNVRAELIRVIKVKREYQDVDADDSETSDFEEQGEPEYQTTPTTQSGPSHLAPFVHQQSNGSSSSKMPVSPLFPGSSYRAVIARSGASCRFHSSRPIQLRFVLHQNPSQSPSTSRTDLGRMDSDIESPLITQSTLLHSVQFRIEIHVSFVDMSNQTERISTLVMPITILPPPAPLPEVSQSLDDAYQKKHDRPPARTVREEEVDPSIPHYSEGEAGPSMLSSGAPPPFEEQDAPPPFFVSALEASSSSRLPTFLESESEVFLPDNDDHLSEIPALQSIPGEGTEFGFTPEDQFDGHSEDMRRSATPPPTVEMASRDTDLTSLTDQPGHVAMEVLTIALDHDEIVASLAEEAPPPPPPAMDDPSDPPPSIDSDFRLPAPVRRSPSRASPPLPHSSYDSPLRLQTPTPTLIPPDQQPSHGHAPPPYLIPDAHVESESDQVTRPPPYVD